MRRPIYHATLPQAMDMVLALALVIALALTLAPGSAQAKDTDIYRPTVKPNVMIMFDSSGSMDWGVYECTEDYGNFYDYLSQRTCGSGYEIKDTVSGGGPGPTNYWYGSARSWTRSEVLLLAGPVGYATGPKVTGDPGDTSIPWESYIGSMRHTGWTVSTSGNNTISADSDGYALLDPGTGTAVHLPNNRSIKVHDYVQNADGTQVDKGLAGQLLAPGYYFSGYFLNNSNQLTSNPAQAKVVNGRELCVFLVPGNWLSMQCVYNLQVVSGCPDAGQPAWKVRSDQSSFHHTVSYSLTSPSYPSNYPNNYHSIWTITQPGSTSIQIHFNAFNTYNSSDNVKLYDGNNQLIATYSGNLGAFWTTSVAGSSVKVEFTTNGSGQRSGWSIDRYWYVSAAGATYQMQRRIDVARQAIIAVIDATLGKISWGLADFNYASGNSGNGAKIDLGIDPSVSATTNRANMLTQLNALNPGAGTPLCEAAQDMYNYFHGHTSILRQCTRNYVIYLTDGFPSADDDNNRLVTGVHMTDADGDGYTQDPSQYATPNPDYFDDAVTYGYRHSVIDGSLESQPASSYHNLTSHCIGLALDAPLLNDAATEGGGSYYVASNEQQLISSFYSLGLLIINQAGYTAPVVSVDSANRTQSGSEVYMAFFKPMTSGLDYWGGNVKRYGLNLRIKGDCIPQRTTQEWVVVDYPGSASAPDATDCEGSFKGTSFSWWDADGQPDGDDVEKGGVGELMALAVSLSSPTARPIYTYAGSGFTALRADNSAITNTLLGVSTDTDRYKIINFVRGFTYDQDSSTHNPVAKRAWPLGDIIHCEPVLLEYCPAGTPHGCLSPASRLLAVGSNDGMLHVFNPETGAEVWSFIPPDLLTKLKNFDPATGINQQDMVDGSLTYYEYQDATSAWKKLLIVSERRGGRCYYALDVTDPSPLNWTMKWVNVNGGSGAGIIGGSTPGFEQLGQSWSRATPAKLRLDVSGHTRLAIMFGGGYDDIEDQTNPGVTRNMGRGFYVVDLETGAPIYSFTNTDNSNLLCVPGDLTAISDTAGCLSYVYFTDTGGNIWKTTCTGGATPTWETHRVFAGNPGSTAASGYGGNGMGAYNTADTGRKMFYPPDVSLGNTYTDYPVLYLGSGDREHPLETTVHNRLYAVIDDIPSGPAYDGRAALTELNLVNVTSDELEASSGVSDTEKSRIKDLLKNSHGWFVKLDQIGDGNHTGEKCLSQATVFYYIAYFTTFTPTDTVDSCNPIGEAKVYALEYSQGTAGLDYSQNGVMESTDRYRVIGQSIASRVKIIIRNGTAAGLISVGGNVTGAGTGGSTRLPQPGSAIETILWRELGPADIARGMAYGIYQ